MSRNNTRLRFCSVSGRKAGWPAVKLPDISRSGKLPGDSGLEVQGFRVQGTPALEAELLQGLQPQTCPVRTDLAANWTRQPSFHSLISCSCHPVHEIQQFPRP